jgi:hypothetical protein
MFAVILKQVWRDSRWMLLFLAACAVVIVRGAVHLAVAPPPVQDPERILVEAQFWGLMMPVLAFTAATLLSIITWWPDRRGWWVYALTLPVRRERYALMRSGAGATVLAGLGVAFAVAVAIAARGAVVPDGLHLYAGGLILRFALALLVSHALWTMFALVGRPVAWAVVGIVVLAIALELVGIHATGRILDALTGQWSPLHVLGGRWMLIDV